MKIQFLGATETVTGSKFHVTHGDHSWLVDCGLFQGLRDLRRRNWQPLPIDIKALNAVLLTHAHIDHTGYLPVLVKHGFRGPILSSAPTIELCKILLPDAGYIQEEDAKFAAKAGFSKHEHPEALYTYKEAVEVLPQLTAIPDRAWYPLSDEVRIMLRPAGHILGSRIINMSVKEKHRSFNIMFAGDVGRYDAMVEVDPDPVKSVNYLVVESTYGSHLHPQENLFDRFEKIINETVDRGGKIIIPAFAVGRTQQVLYILRRLELAGRLPRIPIFLNSPLAIDATDIYRAFDYEHKFFNNGKTDPNAFHPSMLVQIHTHEESKALNDLKEPAILIAASGMLTGGRVLHHLKYYLPDPRSTVVLTGFQAMGTRGRSLVDGAKEIKIHGQMVPVRAQLEDVGSLSAHGDWHDLMRWFRGFTQPPKTTFLVHGEPESIQAMKQHIESELGWHVEVPHYMQKYDL